MRTFSRAHWEAARTSWSEGQFGPEWLAVRDQAAMAAILYPPHGSPLDSWEDDSPSQRAQIVRAVRETPALLSECIAASRSWHDVIAKLNQRRDAMAAEPETVAPAIEPRTGGWRRVSDIVRDLVRSEVSS